MKAIVGHRVLICGCGPKWRRLVRRGSPDPVGCFGTTLLGPRRGRMGGRRHVNDAAWVGAKLINTKRSPHVAGHERPAAAICPTWFARNARRI